MRAFIRNMILNNVQFLDNEVCIAGCIRMLKNTSIFSVFCLDFSSWTNS